MVARSLHVSGLLYEYVTADTVVVTDLLLLPAPLPPRQLCGQTKALGGVLRRPGDVAQQLAKGGLLLAQAKLVLCARRHTVIVAVSSDSLGVSAKMKPKCLNLNVSESPIPGSAATVLPSEPG